MGLDISAYGRLVKAPAHIIDQCDGSDCPDGFVRFYSNSDFPGRDAGIEDMAVYAFASSTGFRAGSYSGYNLWRDELAKLAGYPAVRPDESEGAVVPHLHARGAWLTDTGPFYELIQFSDCEGAIGPTVSAKLARDFAEYQLKADAHQESWFRDLYGKWRNAFELAADGGAVSFH